jgi:excisionase family DNA binding protein
MTTQEAGAYLKLSPRWLEELRVIGGGPLYLKPGKRVLYRKDLLDEWAEAFERQSTAE